MRKFVLAFCGVLILSTAVYGQAVHSIPSTFFGQNAWVPSKFYDQRPSVNRIYGSEQPFWKSYGKLDSHWVDISATQCKMMRYGGTTFNRYQPRTEDYKHHARKMRANGITPVFQISMGEKEPNSSNENTPTVDDYKFGLKAVEILDEMNKYGPDSVTFTRYWIIGNEPDHAKVGFSTQEIADFIKLVVPMMRDKMETYAWYSSSNPDHQLVIIAPELTHFVDFNYGEPRIDFMVTKLLTPNSSTDISGFDSKGRPYINWFSMHAYTFNAPGPINKDQIIDTLNPQHTSYDNFTLNLSKLTTKINSANSFHSRTNNPIRIALTEANQQMYNDTLYSNDGPAKLGARSFSAGQFISEVMSIAMNFDVQMLNFWSSVEGNTSPNLSQADNRGVIDIVSRKPTPAYHHYKMMAQHFLKDFQYGESDTRGVKAFAGLETGGFYVMILNQTDVNRRYRIGFNNANPTLSAPVKLKFDLLSTYYTHMDSTSYNPTVKDTLPRRSTVLLQFDCHGKFVKRTIYTEAMAIAGQAPKVGKIGNINVDDNPTCSANNSIGGTIVGNKEFVNQTVNVTSDLLLASNTKLKFVNSTVVMAPGTKIEATPMASIEIRDSKVVGCEGKTWKGIKMLGNYQNNERLLIDNSIIIGAEKAVVADRIPEMTIRKSTFVSGETAVELNRSRNFTIEENDFADYSEAVRTKNTMPDFVSTIKENRFFDVSTGVKFDNDKHNKLDVVCNEFWYANKGIESIQTELKEMGTTSMGAGNLFMKMTTGQPTDYVEHTGPQTKYFFGPGEAPAFSLPNVMNIPMMQANLDRVCTRITTPCPGMIWTPGTVTESEDVSFKVYPNPSNGQFTLSLNQALQNDGTISVYDVLGKTILSQRITRGETGLDISISAKGLYMVVLKVGEEMKTHKIVVE